MKTIIQQNRGSLHVWSVLRGQAPQDCQDSHGHLLGEGAGAQPWVRWWACIDMLQDFAHLVKL